MPSDIQFNEQEANLFVVLTGMRPPLIPTATLYEAGDLANHTADRIDSELTPLVEQVVNQVLTGMNSAVSPEFADSLARYTSKPPGYFPQTSSQLRQMGDYAVSTAAQVEYMKVEAIATLASLIATLVIEAALSFFFPEIGLEMMAAEFAAVRLILNTVVGRVLAHILSATLIGIGIQVLLDSIAQAVLIGEGIQQSWNWEETGLQVAVGALGGAMGLALHPLEAWASHELAGVIDNLLGDEAKDLAENIAADATKGLADVAGGDSAKDLAGDVAKHVPDGGPADGGPADGGKAGGGRSQPDGGPRTTTVPDGGPAAGGPGWTAPPGVGSRAWVIEKLAEIPVGIVIGGIHNAGHETLFNLFLTGQATWSWETFAGGAAQAVARPIGILIGAGSRMTFGLPLPAENLLAGALGSVTPSMLNEIASAPALPPGDNLGGQPGSVLPGSGGKAAGSGSAGGPVKENDAARPAPEGPAVVVAEPAAVQLLRAVGITPGPETAYSIAVRTGFVPTTGPAEFHSLYARPVMVTLPPMTTSAGMAAAVRPVAALPAAPVPLAQEPPPAYSLVDPLRPASPVQADGVPLPASGGGQTSALTDTPPPVTPPPVTPQAEMPQAETPLTVTPLTESPQAEMPQAETPLTVTPLTESPQAESPQAESPQAEGPQAGGPQAETRDRRLVVPPSDPVRSHGVVDSKGRLIVPPSDPLHDSPANRGAHAGGLQHSGLVSSGPDAVSVSKVRLDGAGTDWVRGGDGWHVASHPGSLELRSRTDGQLATVPVAAGSRAVFDASGRLQHVVLPDGVSYERNLSGEWSAGRTRSGEVIVLKTGEPVTLTSGDGTTVRTLPRESEQVLDNGTVVAYRQVKTDDGTRLREPAVFLPDGRGGWVQTDSPVESAAYEAWLASANQAHEAARTLYDIAARSGLGIPEEQRLNNVSAEVLQKMLRGSGDDAFAAIYEWVRRTDAVALRWTQVSASHALAAGQVVNMAAGEGKSWLFLIDAVRQSVRPGVGAVQVITTRGNLADRELDHYIALLRPLGIDVHRMNPDQLPPLPVDERPTIYLGTSQDVGFTYLRSGVVPGQVVGIRIDAGVDEIDEAFVYSNASYILSEGVQGAASPEIIAQVQQARELMNQLTQADFGRTEGQVGGRAALTEEGRARAEELAGAPLTEAQLKRLNMAATAHFEYAENVHYVVHDGKVFIIDQTTHEVMYNPETATESRWNGGLAQAVEAKHGLTIRDDPATSKSVTAHDLYTQEVYGRVTGASGTALGKGEQFAAQGLSREIADIPRYYDSRLKTEADHVSPDQAAKLDVIAADVRETQASTQNRPQLILVHRNDLVADLSARLTAQGVEHTAIDAKWFLNQGTNREEAFKNVIENAGKPGHVLVINMQGARGVDIPISDEAKAMGGLLVRVTARSGMSEDIDTQAQNRAARSGDPGSVVYYVSPDDEVFILSENPDVQLAIIRYTSAVTARDEAMAAGDVSATVQAARELGQAEDQLRRLVPELQKEAAARLSMHLPAYLANAPPAAAAASPPATPPSTPAQPPQQPPPSPPVTAATQGQHIPRDQNSDHATVGSREQQLRRLRTEQQEITAELESDIVTPGAGVFLRDRLAEINAAIEAITADVANRASRAGILDPGVLGDDVVHAGAGGQVAEQDRDLADRYTGLLDGVNPLREERGDFATNCALTAITVDMSLAEGEPFQAGAAGLLPVTDIEKYAGQSLLPLDGYGAVVDAVRAAGKGARGIVLLRSQGQKHDHALSVVSDEGRVVFLDGQAGRLAELTKAPSMIRLVLTAGDVKAGRAAVAGRVLTAEGAATLTGSQQSAEAAEAEDYLPEPEDNFPGQEDSSAPEDAPAWVGTGGLAPGWEWLDEERGLAVPPDPAPHLESGSGIARWQAADPGAGRDYAVHLPSGVIVLADRRVLGLTDPGWVRGGRDLVHVDAGVSLLANGATVGQPDLEALADVRQIDLAREDLQLSRDELVQWLVDNGGLAGEVPGIATGAGWQHVLDDSGARRWVWNEEDRAEGLPDPLRLGQASGEYMRCLIDSLRQMLQEILPEEQRAGMTRDFLTDWFMDHLPVDNEAFEQVLVMEMVDVWSTLTVFTNMFQVRVQVFEHVDGELQPRPLRGPALDQDGNATPVLHLYWRGAHFQPLLTASDAQPPPRLPGDRELGRGPEAFAAMLRLDRERYVLNHQLTALPRGLAAEHEFGQDITDIATQAEQENATWRRLDILIEPQSPLEATEPLHDIVDRLTGLRDHLRQITTLAEQIAHQDLGPPPIAAQPLAELLQPFRGAAVKYLESPGVRRPAGVSVQDAINGLAAVLAEARGEAESLRAAEGWYAAVTTGLQMVIPTRSGTAYAMSLPGINLSGLNEDDEVTITEPFIARSGPVPDSLQATVIVISEPEALNLTPLTGEADAIMFRPGTQFVVEPVSLSLDSGRITVSLHHPRRRPAELTAVPAAEPVLPIPSIVVSPPPGELPPGWDWLDTERELAVPPDSVRETRVPARWQPASGVHRRYAVDLTTGIIVLANRTVLHLANGWVQHGTSLLHLPTGTALDENAVVRAEAAVGVRQMEALAKRPRLSREDLLAWLAAHGGLTGEVPGVPRGQGWQQLEQDGTWWVWNGPDQPAAPPPALRLGEARGQHVRSLIDSLSRLLRQILPVQQQAEMEPSFLTAWLADHLPLDNEALPFVQAPSALTQALSRMQTPEESPRLTPPAAVPEEQAQAPHAVFAPAQTASAAMEAVLPDFDVVQGDMFALREVLGQGYRVGAVVNAQNPTMLGGTGIAGLIASHGRDALRREVMARFPVRADGSTRIDTTEAVTTHGNPSTMNALFVVHALSPVFPGTGTSASLLRPAWDDLADTYRNAVAEADRALEAYYNGTPLYSDEDATVLGLPAAARLGAGRASLSGAEELNLRTVVFPVLSGGNYRGGQSLARMLEAARETLSSVQTRFIRRIILVQPGRGQARLVENWLGARAEAAEILRLPTTPTQPQASGDEIAFLPPDHFRSGSPQSGRLLQDDGPPSGDDEITPWSVLPTLTNAFGVRVQVFEDITTPAGTQTILASPLTGPVSDEDDQPTPVVHLHWSGAEFAPLFDQDTTPLPLRDRLGGGRVAEVLRLDRERHTLTRRIQARRVPGTGEEFAAAAAQINQTWHDVSLTPQSAARALDVLNDVVGRLRSQYDLLIESLPGTGRQSPVGGLSVSRAEPSEISWNEQHSEFDTSVAQLRQKLSDAEWIMRRANVATWLAEAVRAGRSTKHTDRQNGNWLPARAEAHDRIVEELSRAPGVPRQGRALFVGGLPGAGKSTLVAQLYFGDTPRYLLVDLDEIVLAMLRHQLVPEVEGLSPREAAELVRTEARHIRERLISRIAQERINLVIVSLMDSPAQIERPSELLRQAGYTRFDALFVEMPVDDAMVSADERHRQGHENWLDSRGHGGHYIPASVFQRDPEFGTVNRRVFEEARGRFEHWQLYRRDAADQSAYLGGQGGREERSPLTDAEWNDHLKDVDQRLLEARQQGLATIATHADHGIWKPERTTLHESIAAELYAAASQVPQEGKAVITGGPWVPGAAELARREYQDRAPDRPAYLLIDPQAIEEALAVRDAIPQVEGLTPLEAAHLVMHEVRQITNLLLLHAIAERRNVVIPDDMSDRGVTAGRIARLRGAGYGQVDAVFLDVSRAEVLRRAQRQHRLGHERWRAGVGRGGRFIPPETISDDTRAGFSPSRRNFDALRNRVHSWTRWEQPHPDRRPRRVHAGTPVEGPRIPSRVAVTLSRQQQSALDELGYELTFAAPGSFFAALLSTARPQLGAWFAARSGQAVVSVNEDMLREAMADALTLDLESLAPRYARFLPPGRGLPFLRNQLRDEEGVRDPAVLAALAPHLAADTFGLRLMLMGPHGLIHPAGDIPDRHITAGRDGRDLMLVQLPRGHFTATRSVADSPAALVRQPSLPALKRWPAPSEVDDEPSAALIDQEAEQAILDNFAAIQREGDVARFTVVSDYAASLLADGRHWAELREIIARALRPGDPDSEAARRQLGVLDYVAEESLFLVENRQTVANEAGRMTAAVRTDPDLSVPDGWERNAYASAVAQLAARLELAEDLFEKAEEITVRDHQQQLSHADLAGLEYAMVTYRNVLDKRELAQKQAAAAAKTARETEAAAGGDELAQQRMAEQARGEAYRRFADLMVSPTARGLLPLVHSALTEPDWLRRVIQEVRNAAVMAEADATDRLRQPAKKAAEWRLLERRTQLTALDRQPPRMLPPGFGETDALGQRGFGLGPDGAVERLGSADFSDDEAITRELLGALPRDTAPQLRQAIAAELPRQLEGLGPRSVAQRMLEGGLEFGVVISVLSETGQGWRGRTEYLPTRYVVRVSLEPSLCLGTYLSPADSRRDGKSAPVHDSLLGQRHHVPVEAAHEALSSSRVSSSNTRSASLASNVLIPLDRVLDRLFGVTIQVGAAGESSAGFSSGGDSVSAMKMVFELSGERARYEIPRAVLTMTVQRWSQREQPGTAMTGTALTSLRLSFPREFGPRMDWRRPQPVLAESPSRHRNPVLGPTPPTQALAVVADPASVAYEAAVERMTEVLGQVSRNPESAPGMGHLARQVKGTFADEAVKPSETQEEDAGLHAGISAFLSERTVLTRLDEIITSGALSPLYRAEDGSGSVSLMLQAVMLNVQRVMTDDEMNSAAEPVGIKNEHQRWVNNAAASVTEGGKATLSSSGRPGWTIGDPNAPFGRNQQVAVQVGWDVTFGAGRASSANVGGGEVRGLVYKSSVRYRLTLRMTVSAYSDMPAVDGELASRDQAVFVWVPRHEVSRFEALIKRAVLEPGSATYQELTTKLPPAADPAPKAGEDPVEERYPPASVDALVPLRQDMTQKLDEEYGDGKAPDLGLPLSRGFSVIEQLPGAERIIPTIMNLLAEDEAATSWAPARSPLDTAAILRQLSAKYTRQALTNGPDLLDPSGVSEVLTRAVKGGIEIIEINVFLLRSRQWSSADRVEGAKVELMPADFSGAGTGDTLMPEVALSVAGQGTAGIAGHRNHSEMGQVAPSVQLSLGQANQQEISTKTSAFRLMAMLYEGPVRAFTYERSAYFVAVRVRFLPGREVTTLAARNWLASPRSLPPDDPARPQERAALILGGQVRYVFPEPVARKDRRTDTAGIGAPVNGLTESGQPTRDVLDLFRPPAPAAGQYARITRADVVMEPLGAVHLQAELSRLLREAGLPDHSVGALKWTVTGANFQAAAAASGPSPILASVVGQGYAEDRETQIVIEGFPVNAREDGEQFPFLRMLVHEGGPEMSGALRKAPTSRVLKPGYGLYVGATVPETPVQLYPRLAVQPPSNDVQVVTSQTARVTSGGLVQQRRQFSQQVADMIWRITVIRQDANMLRTTPSVARQSLLTIREGISYLKQEPIDRDLIDPLAPAVPAPRLIRAVPRPFLDSGQPSAKQRLIPMIRATPFGPAGIQIPRVPIVPYLADSLILPGPPTDHPAATAAGDSAGAEERASAEDRLLAMIRAVLRRVAPGTLEDRWEPVGGDPAQAAAPKTLEAFFRPGTLASLMVDLLYGLRLRSTRSLPLLNERVELEITARRDPGNDGYEFREYVPDSTVSRYMFMLDRHGKQRVRQNGLTTQANIRIADNPPFTGRFAGFAVTPQFTSARDLSAPVSRVSTRATRNTFFISESQAEGKAYHLGGELEIVVKARRVRMPGPVLNAATLTLARRGLDEWNDPGNPFAALPPDPNSTETGRFTEIALVPPGLDKPDLEPLVAAPQADNGASLASTSEPAFAVEEISVQRRNSLTRLDIKGADIDNRGVTVTGVDPVKMRLVRDLVISRVRGYRLVGGGPGESPAWWMRNSAAKRTIAPGTAGLEGLHTIFSPGMIGLYLPAMLDGLVEFPGLAREGALLSDNHAKVVVRAALVNSRVQNYYQPRLESVGYHFDEQGQAQVVGSSQAADVTVASTGTSGNILAPPGSRRQQKQTAVGNAALKRGRGMSGESGQKLMTRAEARSQVGPFLRVAADLVVTIAVAGSNERWWLTDWMLAPTSRETITIVLVHDAVELAVAPWFVPRTGLPEPPAMPTPSGLYFPDYRAGRPDDRMRAAFAFPHIPDMDVLHVSTHEGKFMVGGRDLTETEFARILDAMGMNGPKRRRVPLVLVTSDVDEQRARGLAKASNRRLLVAPEPGADAISTPDGATYAWNFEYDSYGRPDTGNWERRRWRAYEPARPRAKSDDKPVVLNISPDLRKVLDDLWPTLGPNIGKNPPPLFDTAARPSLSAVRWGAARPEEIAQPDLIAPAAAVSDLLTVPARAAASTIGASSIYTRLQQGEVLGEIVDTVNGLYFTAAPERSTSLDVVAIRSVPVLPSWVVIGGHGSQARLYSGDIVISPEEFLQIEVVRQALRGAEGLVLGLCDADEFARRVHLLSAQALGRREPLPILASDRQFIVTPDGDGLSGQLSAVSAEGRPVAVTGEFVLHAGRQRVELRTPSLRGAYALLNWPPERQFPPRQQPTDIRLLSDQPIELQPLQPRWPIGPVAELAADESARARQQAPAKHVAFLAPQQGQPPRRNIAWNRPLSIQGTQRGADVLAVWGRG